MRSYKVISEKHHWRHASLCHSLSGNRAYLLHINCSELGSDASRAEDGIPVCIGFKGNMSVTLLLPKAKLLSKYTKLRDNDISKKTSQTKKSKLISQKKWCLIATEHSSPRDNQKQHFTYYPIFKTFVFYHSYKVSKKRNLILNAEFQFLLFHNVLLPFHTFQNSLEYCPVLILLLIYILFAREGADQVRMCKII